MSCTARAGRALALVFAAAGALLAAAESRAADSAVVLMYHRFGEDELPSTSIRTAQLEAQLDYIEQNGYVVVPLAAVLEALATGAPLPERAVAITVDDAYLSVFTVGFPLLRARNLPFTVFVATDPVDRGLPGYMSWEQMRGMAAAGATFANHGAAHDSALAGMRDLTDAERVARVRADVEKAAERLAAELEPLAGAYAYPYGEYDTAVANLLRDMGYTSFGQQSGAVGPLSDRRALPRFPMAEAYGGMDQFPAKVASLPLPVARLEPWEPVTASRRPFVEITLEPAEARFVELACFVGGQGEVAVDWIEPGRRFRAGPAAPVSPGRQRINCTAPRDDGRYLWFSHQWVVQ